MRWFWGLILVIIGLVFLGSNFSWWTNYDVAQIAQFWPLFLILFGISLLARRLSWGWIIIVISFLGAIWFVYYSLSAKNLPSKTQKINSQGISNINFSENLSSGINKAKINISAGAIEMNISDGQKLIEGYLISRNSTPELDINNKDNVTQADLKINTKPLFWINNKNQLGVKITNQVPVDLKVNSGASKMNLDLKKMDLNSLDVNTGASSIDLEFEKLQNNAKISISAGASSIKIRLPKNVGVEIKAKTGLSGKDFIGFKKMDNITYQNDSFSTASTKITIELNTGASSIQINQF